MKTKLGVASIFLVIMMISLSPMTGLSWTTVTNYYDFGDDEKNGDGWTEYDYSTNTGDIEIEQDHWWGSASCDIWIGECITVPNYGGDNWKIKLGVSYRRSYSAWASWFNSYTIVLKIELHDSAHGVDWSTIVFSIVDGTSDAEDTTELEYCYPSLFLIEGEDYYIVYHVYLVFNGWSNMDEYAGSGYSTARFDLLYLTYEFYMSTGGDNPE